jgi:uncharacterized membrane protein YgcG
MVSNFDDTHVATVLRVMGPTDYYVARDVESLGMRHHEILRRCKAGGSGRGQGGGASSTGGTDPGGSGTSSVAPPR